MVQNRPFWETYRDTSDWKAGGPGAGPSSPGTSGNACPPRSLGFSFQKEGVGCDTCKSLLLSGDFSLLSPLQVRTEDADEGPSSFSCQERKERESSACLGPKWSLRSHSCDAIWGKCVGGSAFPASFILGRAKSRSILPLPPPEYRFASFLSPCPFPSFQTPSSLTPPQRASLWEGNRLGSPWCLGGLLLIGLEKMILPHSCRQSWAPVTREKPNADSRVELPAETLCQAQTPEVGEDSRALRWERSRGEAMRDPHWSPPAGC